MDDFEAVLAAAQRGDGRAFEALFVALGGPVAGYVRSRGADDPDDLANEVFVRVFRAIGTFRGDEARFRSWVFTIAHNAVLDERRRARRRPLPAGRSVEGESLRSPRAPDAAEEVLARLARERVEKLLARLAPDQRDVFLLRVVGDLSISETAAVLGKSYEAVKALQRRGAAALRQMLEAEGVPK